jgi:hypothetical protein
MIDELEKQYVQAPLEPKSTSASPERVSSTNLAQLARESSAADM